MPHLEFFGLPIFFLPSHRLSLHLDSLPQRFRFSSADITNQHSTTWNITTKLKSRCLFFPSESRLDRRDGLLGVLPARNGITSRGTRQKTDGLAQGRKNPHRIPQVRYKRPREDFFLILNECLSTLLDQECGPIRQSGPPPMHRANPRWPGLRRHSQRCLRRQGRKCGKLTFTCFCVRIILKSF